MSVIYDLVEWQTNTQYFKNSVIWGGNAFPYFFYSAIDHVSGDLATDIAAGLWNGTVPSTYAPFFFWLPSYNYPVQSQPRVKIAKFGDGYEQRTYDGIATYLLTIDYLFEDRNFAEASAILHFLKIRGGVESFYHIPVPPYDKQKLFVCRAWDSTQVFVDNFTVKAKFEEVTV